MKKKQAEEILNLIDQFSVPIANLSEALGKIENEEDRKRFRRALGEVMGLLDGEIGYPLRRRFSISEVD